MSGGTPDTTRRTLPHLTSASATNKRLLLLASKRSLFMSIIEGIRKASSWFFPRLVCFLSLLVIAQQVGGWLRGPLWLAVILAGVWTFIALRRESRTALDFLIPRLERGWQWVAERAGKPERIWRIVGLLCAAVIVSITLYRTLPIWHFKATSSLRDDEIMSIVRYTSRGFVPAISTYSLARNHIFFNVVSSLIPGANSTLPLRARLVSFVSAVASLGLLIAYSAKRGWLLPGLACAGLVTVNFFAMDRVLEARGYGLIFLFAMLSCIAFAEWLRTRRKLWLNLMAVSCVLGTYTLPFYVVFAGGLLLIAFLFRPSRETLLTGFFSMAAILMLYLPIAGKVYSVFTGYGDRYRNTFVSQFDSIDGVYSALEFFFPVQIEAVTFVLVALITLVYVAFARFASRFDRLTVAGIAVAMLGFLAFCLYCKTVPTRVAVSMAAPLAFLAALMTGSLISTRMFAPVRPVIDVLFTAFVAVTLWKSEISRQLIPSIDWRGVGVLIERAFPKDMPIWILERNRTLLQWNLSSRVKPQAGVLDHEALGNGRLIAVEGTAKPSDEQVRFRWENLPQGVRFVTFPLVVNYQRVFFTPPRRHGIASILVNNQRIEPRVSGRQPYDPGTLAQSLGHGDVLRPKDGDEESGHATSPQAAITQPSEIPLPAVMTVELDPELSATTCNLLFSQGMHDKLISAETRNAGGAWRATSNIFVRGELVSVGLKPDGPTSVRIRVENNPAFSDRISDTGRPPFGLIEAWTAASDRPPD
jgi:hypothetical protein